MKIFKHWSEAVFYYMIAIIEAVLSTYFAFVLSRLVDLASNGTIDAVLKFLIFVFVYLVISILVTYFFKAYNNKLVYKYMLSYKNAVYGSSLTDRHSEGVNAGEYINALTNDAVQL